MSLVYTLLLATKHCDNLTATVAGSLSTGGLNDAATGAEPQTCGEGGRGRSGPLVGRMLGVHISVPTDDS
jgi:hypothetical protein